MEASENLTIDEQLLEHHGQVDFRQYIVTKPGKFGIKIYWQTEAKSSYCPAGFVYIGADSIPKYITEELSSTTESTVCMQHFIGVALVGWVLLGNIVVNGCKRKTAYWG